jgi:monomeric sarcosine oxidase
MSEDYEYCVLGGGVIGSAAAYLLARSGASVVLVEQFELGHERGSSHGESRITRYSYDHPYYVRMAKRAYPLWDEIMQESGEKLFLKTGGLDLDEENGERIAACISSMSAEKVKHEVLDAREIRRRFPQFHIPDHTQGLWQDDTGILSAALCVGTLQKLAEKHGARLKANTAVTRIEYDGKGARIFTKSGTIKTKKLILCAGGWMGPLLHGLGVKLPLQVTQEQYAFFQPHKPEAFAVGKFPVFIHYGGAGSGGIGWYGFPVFGKDGVKSSIHKTGKPVTADTRDFKPDEQKLEQLHELMRELLPDAAGKIIHTATCLYTNTPDTHFVIDHLPGRDNAVFFSGCSGHSFKFSAVIAEMLIDMVNKKQPLVPMDLFCASRFRIAVPS